MKRLYLSLFVLILFSFPVFSQTFDCAAADSQNSRRNQLSNEDKAQIVEAVLLDFDFLSRYIYKDEKKEIVYLSANNISLKFIPKVLGISFVLLNSQEITEKAKNDFGYFVFRKIKTDKIKTFVCFEYNYQDGSFKHRYPNSSGSSDTTTGVLYEFSKINNKWQGKVVYGYRSQS